MDHVIQSRTHRGWQTIARVHKRVAAERIAQYARVDDHDDNRIRIIEVENAVRLGNIVTSYAHEGIESGVVG